MQTALATILLPTGFHGLVPRACKVSRGVSTLLFPTQHLGPEGDLLWALEGHQSREKWQEFSWLPGYLTVLLWGIEGQEGAATPSWASLALPTCCLDTCFP